ncbi:Eukaryotic-type carbonic anhydrase [seawater metagenome]|uniref:carbonic anhydrase n=1 Tax=seawater metagenome TaxID=1561972 RepID=A0A5E8CH43_9ZZZZ
MYRLLYLFLVLLPIFYLCLEKFNSKFRARTKILKNKSKLMFNSIRERSIQGTPISELTLKTWDYKENGMDWVEFIQLISPIDIDTTSTIKQKNNNTLVFHSPNRPISMYGNNNGKAVYFMNTDNLVFCEYKKELYRFQEINYHHSSEHSVNSISFDGEIQLFHISKNDQILIISLLVEYKEDCDSYFYDQFFKNKFEDIPNFKLSSNISYPGTKKSFDFNKIFNEKLKDSNYYIYQGSLNVPAYVEQEVTWIICKDIIYIPTKLSNVDGLTNNSLEVKKNFKIPIIELTS